MEALGPQLKLLLEKERQKEQVAALRAEIERLGKFKAGIASEIEARKKELQDIRRHGPVPLQSKRRADR